MSKLLKLAEMQEIARVATRNALQDKHISDETWKVVTLGSRFDDNFGVFELYIPGPRPQDAKVLSQSTVNRRTGEVVTEVFL